MSGFTFTGIASDVRIETVGQLFKPRQERPWRIALSFFPAQPKDSLALSNAPVLYRKSLINPTEPYRMGGWEESFWIEGTKDWGECRIKDCPIKWGWNRQDKNQFCFVFTTDCGKTVYLPQFELARVLFFHDAYLSCSALASKAILLEFDKHLERSSEAVVIKVLPTTGYAVKHFNNPQSRQMLAWILLDPEVRRSYESIEQRQLMEGVSNGRWRSWDFRFEPPSLAGAFFKVRGRFDGRTNSLFVFSIDHIKNITANVPETICFEHLSYKYPVRPDGSGDGGASKRPMGDMEIEDDTDADIDTVMSLIPTFQGSIAFRNPFSTESKITDTRYTSYGRSDSDQSSSGDRKVSTDEAVQGGENARADWSKAGDSAEDCLLFENKFSCFKKMIDELVTRHGCVLMGREIHRLPSLVRCTKHLMSNGDPRCIAVVRLGFEGKIIHMLEVDTSDAEKPLSTQLLRVITPDFWRKDLDKLNVRLVKGSLRWPTEVLDIICGPEGRKGIPHPKTPSSNKGMLTADSISSWAVRVKERMKGL